MPLIEYLGKKPRVHESVFVAPTAYIVGDVEIGEGSSVWFGAVIRGDLNKVVIGKNVSVQDNVVIHPDKYPAVIHDNVLITHGAVLEGVEIGENTLIGIGAVILDGAKIGKNCIIGAGAVVLNNQVIPDNSIAVGVPAKVIKQVSEEHIKAIREGVEVYLKLGRNYKQIFSNLTK